MDGDRQEQLPHLDPPDRGGQEAKVTLPAAQGARSSASRSSRGRRTKPRRPDKESAKKAPRSSSRREEADDGAELERRVARMEFAEGALVRLRIPVRAEIDPGRDVLTDIDVLSVDVDLRLRVKRSILECKSGSGQAGEPDRLFWLVGLKAFVGAERAVLVRNSASRRGVALARRLGVHLLDGPTLGAREAAHAWVPERFAHISGDECRVAETRTDTQLRAFGEIPGVLISFLRHEALLADPHRVLGGLVALDSMVRSMGVLPDPAGLVLAGHALTALVLAALCDAAQAETLPNADLRRRLELALTAGNPDDDHVLEVLGQADELFRHHVELLHRAYVESGGKRVDVEIPSLRDLVAEPPPWVERYTDLVDRLRANPAVARDLPQTTELACFDALLGANAWKAAAFDHLFTAEHRNLLMVAAGVLREIAGEPISDRLGTLASLPFDRRPPALPDRRRPADASASKAFPVPLARDPKDPTEPTE